MSGDDKAPKELTDQQRVDVQVGQVDAVSGVSNVMHDAFGFKRVRLLTYGKVTDFEDHQLNAMIDLVHQANPADLEHMRRDVGEGEQGDQRSRRGAPTSPQACG